MRALSVKDNLLSKEAQGKVIEYVCDGWFKWGWSSNTKTDVYSFWHKHYAGTLGTDHPGKTFDKPYDCADELKELHPLLHQFWQFLSSAATIRPGPLVGHTLVRCYANAYPYGSEGSIHTDSVSPKSFTTIYYPHERWSPNWAGETVFFNKEETDVIACVYPKPNRLLTFMGTIPHVARGVSRTCPHNRVTFMMKTVAP